MEILQDALVDLYSASLELLANSSKLFSNHTAAQTVYAILNPGKTEGIFTKLADLETKLGCEVQVWESERSVAADMRLMDLLRVLNTPITRIDQRVGTLLERINEKDQLEILKWISPTPFGKHHSTVREARTSDTCEWLLQHERFREWEDSSSSVP